MRDEELKNAVKNFEKNFGTFEDTDAYYHIYNNEDVIIVENFYRRAIFSIGGELIKVTKIREEN